MLRRASPLLVPLIAAVIGACQHAAPNTTTPTQSTQHRSGVVFDQGQPPGIWSDRWITPSAYEHYLRSQLYAEHQQLDRAIDEVRLAIAFDPEGAELYAWLAELLLLTEDLLGAQEAIDLALRADTHSPAAAAAQAHLAARREDWPAAAHAAARAVHLDPHTVEHRYDLIAALDRLQRSPEALHAAEDLAQRWPHDPRAHTLRGRLLVKLQRLDEAAEAFQEVIDLRPRSTTGYYDLADLHLQRQRFDDARHVFTACTDTCVKPPGCWFKRVRLARVPSLAAGPLDPDARRELHLMAEALAPDPDAAAAVAARIAAIEDLPLLQAWAEIAAQAQPHLVELYYHVGLLALRLNHKNLATDALARVPHTSTFFLEARARLAITLSEQGHHREAAAALNQPLALEPDQLDLWSLKAAIFERADNFKDALDALEHAAALGPERPELHLRLATIAWRLRLGPRAVRALERALELSPHDPHALTSLARILALTHRDLPRAETLALDAIQRSPDQPGAPLVVLGIIYLRVGRHPEAIAALQRAAPHRPRDPEPLSLLGDAYDADGQRDLAIAAYQSALERTRPEPERAALRRKIRTLSARHP